MRVFPIRYPHTNEPYQVYGAQVFPLNGGSFTAGLQRWKMLWNVEPTVLRQHKIMPFDVLHAIWADETGYITNRIGRAIDVPSVVSIAGGELVSYKDLDYGLQRGTVTRWLVNQALKQATQIVAPCIYSAQLTKIFLKFHHLPENDRVNTVPLGVNTNLFNLPETDHRPIEFLHVASLNPIKRQDMLLELVARMPGIRLDIVGGGKRRDYLKRLAVNLDIADRVIFHGEVAHDELPAFYRSARWLLMTSQHEAFCMAAVEALACGAGVIGTAVGVIPEIGKFAPVDNLEALMAHIVSRPRNENIETRRKRHELAKSLYSIENMTQGLLQVYEKAVEMGR